MVALKVIHGNSDISVHGFRTTFSTLAREMDFNPAHIEKQLAHREGNSVIEAYDRSIYFEQRRGDMQKWADYLDELRDDILEYGNSLRVGKSAHVDRQPTA
jgi:integrase